MGWRGWACGMAILLAPLGAIAADAPAIERELVLGLRVAPPFAMKSPEGIWSGVTVELWRHMADQLGLRYRLVEMTQDALMQGLADGTLDASGGALTVTGERLRQVDFSLPYLVTGTGVAVPLRPALDWRGVAMSFLSFGFLSIVAGILGALLLVSVIVWLLERRHTTYFGGRPSDGLVCSITWSTQAMARANNPSVTPTTRPGRLLGAAWTAASVALIAIFTAAVTSHLTARELSGAVRDAADLHHARVGTIRGAAAIGTLDREGIQHQDFTDVEAGLGGLAAGELDALVYDKPILAWQVLQNYPNAIKLLDFSLEPQSYAIGLPFGSSLRQQLNVALADRTRTVWWRELVGRYLGGE